MKGKPNKKVVITTSPVTERYVRSGDIGEIDYNVTPAQIRVNGVWFTFDESRWEVISKKDNI